MNILRVARISPLTGLLFVTNRFALRQTGSLHEQYRFPIQRFSEKVEDKGEPFRFSP